MYPHTVWPEIGPHVSRNYFWHMWLIELLRLCTNCDGAFEMIRPALEPLNTFAVVVRYPRAFAAKDEARDAVQETKQVREFVRGLLDI